MRILVACEFSCRVRDAFRSQGHDAYSCDLLPAEGDAKYHIQSAVSEVMLGTWDMMIAFPPCTYLTTTANRSFVNNPDRWQKRLDAMLFVHSLINANIDRICLENPVGVISTHIRKPDQYIQPYEYGHTDSKKTCLWLKNLPLLMPTNIVEPVWVTDSTRGKRYSKTHFKNPGGHVRSITYQGIADAMADQWG